MKGGLIDRARGVLQRRKDRKQKRLAASYRQGEREDIRRRGQEWVSPQRGGEHRPVWKMVPSPGPQRDALRNERRARRRRLHRSMGKGIVGYKTNARAGQL